MSVKENIKVANQRMESAYLNENIFEKLEDTESLYWNYFDEKGDIPIVRSQRLKHKTFTPFRSSF